MSNYHFEASVISRGKGRSISKLMSYISGKQLYDNYLDKTFYHSRTDVLYCDIYLPTKAPEIFQDIQSLCNKINEAEKRYDARTAREFKCSLPNELSPEEIRIIVKEFVMENFLIHNLCAIAAIHEGKNTEDPSKNNPHVHIIVPTRALDNDGFSKMKMRELDKKNYINIWRESWARIQNKAYERNGLNIRVSHESYKARGILDREPTIHISKVDWQKERLGIRTRAGDRKRDIKYRNKKREYYALQREKYIDRAR